MSFPINSLKRRRYIAATIFIAITVGHRLRSFRTSELRNLHPLPERQYFHNRRQVKRSLRTAADTCRCLKGRT
jgi:hypothetical protein